MALVTIGVCTADARSPHAQRCLEQIYKYTKDFELIVLDNQHNPQFNHSAEMNRIIAMSKARFVVLMDDDVFVMPFWLDGMLEAAKGNVKVVTPQHCDEFDKLSYSGITLHSTFDGNHWHLLNTPGGVQKIQTFCSAIALFDFQNWNCLFDETMEKYFLDIDFGLRVWESGGEVVCTPFSQVVHLGGKTCTRGTPKANQAWGKDWARLREIWGNGRLLALDKNVWSKVPDLVRG